jgi:hypothetical protein
MSRIRQSQGIGGAKGTQKRDIKRALEMMDQLEG